MQGRRRTFLGTFLQRASRLADENGGGSLTILAFSRLRDVSASSRADLEKKLAAVEAMPVDEVTKARARARVEQQLEELGEDNDGSGILEDFLEEVKAWQLCMRANTQVSTGSFFLKKIFLPSSHRPCRDGL
eukprot:5482500-Amphidinium_carterae.1